MPSPLFRDTLDKHEPLQCRDCSKRLITADADGCDECGAVLCSDCALERDLEQCDQAR